MRVTFLPFAAKGERGSQHSPRGLPASDLVAWDDSVLRIFQARPLVGVPVAMSSWLSRHLQGAAPIPHAIGSTRTSGKEFHQLSFVELVRLPGMQRHIRFQGVAAQRRSAGDLAVLCLSSPN